MVYDEMVQPDGKIEFRRDQSKILIATNEFVPPPSVQVHRSGEESKPAPLKRKNELPVEEVFSGRGREVWEKVVHSVLRETLHTGEFPLLVPKLESNESWLRLHATAFQPEFALPIEAPPLEFFAFLP